MTGPPPDLHPTALGDAELDQALGQLPELALDPQRSAALLRSAQQALAAAAPHDPAWLLWYERRLEPALLTLACAVYLVWAVAAALPPPAAQLADSELARPALANAARAGGVGRCRLEANDELRQPVDGDIAKQPEIL